MLLLDYASDLFSVNFSSSIQEIPMTKIAFCASDGWTTIYVPNDQIEAQLQTWDEQGVDYSLPA